MLKPLPRALAAWAEALAPFADETRAVLGPWLPALERLLGPHPREQPDERGEPDGFSGLGRRGRYERLALSEWGLLEAAPQEFLRRAGSGEHLFHQIARAAPTGGQRLIVLFDAGPLQLGAPRLVHLAWLLLLARRAARNGVELRWGVVQQEGAGLRGQTDTAAVRALLAARAATPLDAERIAAWAAALGARTEGEERWLVAGAAGGLEQRAAEALGALPVVVAETDEPGVARLCVETRAPAGLRTRALLPPPAPELCVRLLRDPFPAAHGRARDRAEDATLAAGEQILFAGTGGHLLARLTSGDVVALAVRPADTERPLTPVARFSPADGEEVLAVGWRKGKLYVLTLAGKRLQIRIGRGGSRFRAPAELVLPGGAPLPRVSPSLLLPLVIDAQASRFWLCDTVWRLHHGSINGGVLDCAPDTTLACGWAMGNLVSVARTGRGDLELCSHRRGGTERVVMTKDEARASAAYLALDRDGSVVFVAVSAGGGPWRLCPVQPGPVPLFPGSVHSLLGAAASSRRPELLVRTSDNTRLEILRRGGSRGPLAFPGAVEHACLHPHGVLVAAQVGGGLHVVDPEGKRRLRWGGGEP